MGNYDAAVNLVVEADVLTKGQLVQNEIEAEPEPVAGPSASGSSSNAGASSSSVPLRPGRTYPNIAGGSLKEHEHRKVEDGESPR